ncbi:kinase-like protein [Thamnocephalis sphaerospora]|uniref:non-specific serine/threonine protein kinase n=1 Tax=Thamnocephalis sphaerospora TaxID=78915 RepID=A0A4P9XN74_9FUNG|nr:kinase-like protein [Thamnocephalis sphaerospora]|eukprot:RKP07378.1 kinase-like protein [Thamnocephalis sphaerospora]
MVWRVDFYNYYYDLLSYLHQRRQRQHHYEVTVHATHVDRDALTRVHLTNETNMLRARRSRMSLDHFQLLSQIGQGGYGCVYLARKRDTGEICAVKKMSKRLLHKLNEAQHILTERDILTAAKSPWLVRLFYAFQDAACLYLAMEYVPGGDLRTLLNHSGILRLKNARFYFAEMAMAVDALHQLGYIHRDLKPENFLIDAAGHIKLADFGLSNGMLSQKRIDSIRQKLDAVRGRRPVPRSSAQRRQLQATRRDNPMLAYSTVGSPDYMAPEVLRYTVGYGHLVDYWSLGCILFEFLAGHTPFAGATIEEVWANVYHWERVLVRPTFNSPVASANLTDDAWHLICRLITHREHRLSSFEAIRQHPFLRGLDCTNLRPPFVPSLTSTEDTGYFDDFSDPSDMRAYRDVLERQAHMEEMGRDAVEPPRATFVGFTFRHRSEEQKCAAGFGGDHVDFGHARIQTQETASRKGTMVMRWLAGEASCRDILACEPAAWSTAT